MHKTSNLLVFFIVLFTGCLTQFASDIYAPSLPAIADDFQTNVDLTQWSMAIYLLGVATTQLIYGPLSEGIGRKGPLIAGLSIMLLGSLICFLATDIHMLIWGRFIQGCGAGAAATLWRSIFRDVFSGEELSKFGSYMVILFTFIVPAAPALGGILQESFGWRSIFTFMLIYTAGALLFVVFKYKETNLHRHTERLKLAYITKTYSQMLTNPIFMGTTICTFLTYGAFFSWFVVGPVLLIKHLGVDPMTFGLFSLFVGVPTYSLAGWINAKFVKKAGIPFMLRLGWGISIFAALLMLVGSFIFGLNIWVIFIPILLFYFGTTFIWPNVFATAFTPFGKIAGYAGALYGFMQISGGSVLGGIMSFLPNDNQFHLGLTMLLAPLISLLIYECVVLKHEKKR